MNKDVNYIPIDFITLDEAIKILEIDSVSRDNIRWFIKELDKDYLKYRDNKGRQHLLLNSKNIYAIRDEAKVFFENHYLSKEVRKVFSKETLNKKLDIVKVPKGFCYMLIKTRFPDGDIPKNLLCHNAYRKQDFHNKFGDLENLLKNKSESTINTSDDNFISADEAIKLLNVHYSTPNAQYEFLTSLNLRKGRKGNKLYFNKEDILEIIDKANEFFEKHILMDDLSEDIPKKDLTAVPIPFGYNAINFAQRYPNREYKSFKKAYSKKEISSIKDKLNKLKSAYIYEGKVYITLDEALNLGNYCESTFYKLRKEFNIRNIRVKREVLFCKEDIRKLFKCTRKG